MKIPQLPAYRRADANAWTREVLTTLRDHLQLILAHNRTAATRGEIAISSDEQMHGIVVRAKVIGQQLAHAGKGTHTSELVEELENIWSKVHHLAQQIPPTGIAVRRK